MPESFVVAGIIRDFRQAHKEVILCTEAILSIGEDLWCQQRMYELA